MLPSDVAARARYLTKTTSSDGTGDDSYLLGIVNDYYLRQAIALINLNQDKFGVQATTDLNVTENQESYALPSDMVKMKRMEITYDGSLWHPVRMTDVGLEQRNATDPATIAQEYTTAYPKADIFGDSLYLRPIPSASVAGGLKMWYVARPALLSTMSSVISTPVDYHGYLSYGVAAEIATRQANDALAAQMFQKWEDGLKKMAQTFPARDLDMLTDSTAAQANYG